MPQCILFLRVLKKLWPSRFISLTLKVAGLIDTMAEGFNLKLRLSNESRKLVSLPDGSRVISPSNGTTQGRFVRLCGAMGVMMATLELGETIGPPALRL